jgi:hypothetical protein
VQLVRSACARCQLSIAQPADRDDPEDGTHFPRINDHLAIEHAIRRAELLALGAPTEFVQAVLCTRLATDLSNGMFWRTVWSFLISNAGIIDPAQIGPMIDFIQAIRHDRVAMDAGRNGGVGSASAGVFNQGASRTIDATFDAGLASDPWRGRRRSRMDTVAITTDAPGRTESGRFSSAETVADDETHQ